MFNRGYQTMTARLTSPTARESGLVAKIGPDDYAIRLCEIIEVAKNLESLRLSLPTSIHTISRLSASAMTVSDAILEIRTLRRSERECFLVTGHFLHCDLGHVLTICDFSIRGIRSRNACRNTHIHQILLHGKNLENCKSAHKA